MLACAARIAQVDETKASASFDKWVAMMACMRISSKRTQLHGVARLVQAARAWYPCALHYCGMLRPGTRVGAGEIYTRRSVDSIASRS